MSSTNFFNIFIFIFSVVNPDTFCALVSLAGGDAHCVRDSVYSRFWIPMNFEMAFDKNTQDFCAVTDFNESRSRVKKSKINQSPENIQHIAILQYNVLNYKINSKVISAFKDVEMYNLKNEGFTVIEISPFVWNRMGMDDEKHRVEYLKTLFINQGVNLNIKKENAVKT